MPEGTLSELVQAYDVIRRVDQSVGSALLIGEHHSSTASRRLVTRTLDVATPELVAIESCPTQQSFFDESDQNVSEGAEAALSYVRANGKELGLLDKAQTELVTELATLPTEHTDTDPPAPTATGDIPRDALANYRETVRTECPRRYELLWEARERHMAGLLQTLLDTTDGLVVAIVGAGHLHAISDQLATSEVRAKDVAANRVLTPQ